MQFPVVFSFGCVVWFSLSFDHLGDAYNAMYHFTETYRLMCFGRGAEVVLPVEKLEESEGFSKLFNGDVLFLLRQRSYSGVRRYLDGLSDPYSHSIFWFSLK